MKRPAAIVVGGGVGGLCAAIRLRAAGHAVTVFERNEVVGGKLAVYERDGFVFDIGPSLLTLPQVFDDVFRVAGTSLADEVDLVRLPAPFTYHWSPDARSGGRSDGHSPASLTVHDDRAPDRRSVRGVRSRAPVPSGVRSSTTDDASGRSLSARSSRGRCRTRSICCAGCGPRRTCGRSIRSAPCTVLRRRRSSIRASRSGPAATPPTRGRRRTQHPPR